MAHEIRAGVAGDAEALGRLVVAIGGFAAHAGRPDAAIAETVARTALAAIADPTSTLLVVEAAAGNLIGYANVHWVHGLFLPGPEGYLSELFLAADQRGAGIGTELLRVIIAEARERGAYRLSLLNAKARPSYERAYYEQRGWREREEIASFVYLLGA